jgi:glutamine synthetase
MFCDIQMPDGSPSYADPRWVLKRTMAKAADMGFTFYTHPEIEFYLFENDKNAVNVKSPEPVDHVEIGRASGEKTPAGHRHSTCRRQLRGYHAAGASGKAPSLELAYG